MRVIALGWTLVSLGLILAPAVSRAATTGAPEGTMKAVSEQCVAQSQPQPRPPLTEAEWNEAVGLQRLVPAGATAPVGGATGRSVNLGGPNGLVTQALGAQYGGEWFQDHTPAGYVVGVAPGPLTLEEVTERLDGIFAGFLSGETLAFVEARTEVVPVPATQAQMLADLTALDTVLTGLKQTLGIHWSSGYGGVDERGGPQPFPHVEVELYEPATVADCEALAAVLAPYGDAASLEWTNEKNTAEPAVGMGEAPTPRPTPEPEPVRPATIAEPGGIPEPATVVSAPSTNVTPTPKLKLTHAEKPDWLCSGETPKCATLIVHVAAVGCGKVVTEAQECPPFPEEKTRLRIAKLGSRPICGYSFSRCWGDVLGNSYAREHTVFVAPGHYGITTAQGGASKEVRVKAGQTLEVMLRIVRR